MLNDPNRLLFIYKLERALRALASSSGGAACPGGTRGQPRGSTPGVDPGSQGVIPRRVKRKKIFVTHARRTHGWTDRRVGRNSDVDSVKSILSHSWVTISMAKRSHLEFVRG